MLPRMLLRRGRATARPSSRSSVSTVGSAASPASRPAQAWQPLGAGGGGERSGRGARARKASQGSRRRARRRTVTAATTTTATTPTKARAGKHRRKPGKIVAEMKIPTGTRAMPSRMSAAGGSSDWLRVSLMPAPSRGKGQMRSVAAADRSAGGRPSAHGAFDGQLAGTAGADSYRASSALQADWPRRSGAMGLWAVVTSGVAGSYGCTSSFDQRVAPRNMAALVTDRRGRSRSRLARGA